jgi:hypothetical protein
MTLALDAIYNDLVHTLGKIGKIGKVGKDAVAYSTVTKYARSAQSSGRKEGRKPPEVGEAIDQSFDHIFDVLLNHLDTSEFVQFVELTELPDFRIRHEQQILEILDSLIAHQFTNIQAIDRWFRSLGRGKDDFPDLFNDFERCRCFGSLLSNTGLT